MQNSKGTFINGWTGIKICKKCNTNFSATSGSQKTCDNCRKCKQCNKQLKHSHRSFCNTSCSGKWKYINYNSVQTIINNGRELAYTPETREKIRLAHASKPKLNMRGDKNPNWKGGRYGSERHTLMGRIEYKNWRISVFQRDDYTCQECGKRGNCDLEADHIIPYIEDKTKVFDIDNGRTLCKPCHKKTETWGHKVHKYLKNKGTDRASKK